MKRFFAHGAIVFGGIVLGYGSTYVYYVSCARALGTEQYGLLSALLGVVLLGALPASFVTVFFAKIAATLRGKNDGPALAALAHLSTLSIVAVSGSVLLAGLLMNRLFFGFFRTDDPAVLILTAAAFSIVAVLPLQRAVLQGIEHFSGFAVSNIVEGALRGAAGLAMMRFGGSVRLALGAIVVAGAIALVTNVGLLRGKISDARGQLPSISIGDAARTALPLAALTLMTFSDVVIARHIFAAQQAGLYNVVSLVGRLLITAVTTFPTVLLPLAVARALAGRSAAPLLVAAIGAAGAIAAAVVGICIWNAPLVLFVLGGPAYVGGAGLVVPYVLAASSLAGATILATYLTGIHRTYIGIPLTCVAFAVPAALLVFAHDAAVAVHIVLLGHCCAMLVSVIALVLTRRPAACGIDPVVLSVEA